MSSIPQLVRDASRLLTEIELATGAFPRSHRYRLGNDMRYDAANAVLLCQQLARAAGNRELQAKLLKDASSAIDGLKLRIQLAHSLQCYSLERCRMLATLARACGRQIGGWLKHVEPHPKGQNSAAHGPRERA